jgi:bifunctional UDP-N-acetylglucosamine pyrophosphorylase/glucosamine-1-phosphate N-acetyltransferase
MPELHIVVLAAGKGTRMKSARPKVLHRIAGRPMIAYVLDTAAQLQPATTTVVIGHQADVVRATLSDRPGVRFVVQEPQLGTAHALLSAEPALAGAAGTLLLLSGDVPRLSVETLRGLLDRHAQRGAATSVVTATIEDPTGYGRIVRKQGVLERIVEERDATPAEREIREINAGIYAFSLDGLFDALRTIAAENAQREFYLPDLVAIHRASGAVVEAFMISDGAEVRGINSRAELAELSRTTRQATNLALMAAGVNLEDPATTYIDQGVEIGADTVLRPGVTIEGRSRVGARCTIHSGVRITDSTIADDVTVLDHTVITDSNLGAGASIGPFAHLRNHAEIGPHAKIGNFVEVKKSAIGEGSKASHLSYLGDAVVGTGVNIGAGTITCNYDGVRKQTTTIEDGAFIGSDTQLVAPVTVGKGAYVGTGTTVREDVPPDALAVSAGKQRNIEGWRKKKTSK